MLRRLPSALALAAAIAVVAVAPRAGAQVNATPPELEGVDVVEHLGAALPRDAVFRDHAGRDTRLGGLFDGKRPVLLVFAYYTCPTLCSLVADAVTRGLRDVAWTVGREFYAVVISIDPRDGPDTAARKRDRAVAAYGRPGSADGWHFLVGDEPAIRAATDAVGFRYRWDERQKQYAHPAAVYLLSPDGRVARYLYGIEYDPKTLRMALLEASEGRAVSTIERILLYCYHYDPQGKRYALVAMRVMRIAGAASALALGAVLFVLWRRERWSRGPSRPRGAVLR